MLEILKETDRRLVLALGSRSSGWTKIIADKDADRLWIEQHRRLLPPRTREFRLGAIAAITSQTVGHSANAVDKLVVGSFTGDRCKLSCAAGVAQATAARLRTFIDIGDGERRAIRIAPSLLAWGRRAAATLALGAAGAAAIAVVASFGGLAIGAAGKASSAAFDAAERLGSRFALPECDAQASREAILDLVRDRLGPSATLEDVTERTHDRGVRICSAVARRGVRTATVSYRSYWDGWSPRVRLTGDIVAPILDPSRRDAITRAAEKLLAAAGNSHLTGTPPGQSDPAIDEALATLFGASDLAAEPLLPDEIDAALQWLKTADRVGAVYLLAGTGFSDFAQIPRAEATQTRMRANVVAFADEFGRYEDFQMIVLAAVANAQMRMMRVGGAPSEAMNARAEEIRTLLAQAIKSNVIALVYDGHDDAWRMARLTTVIRTAPIAAKLLTRDEAADVRQLALRALDYFRNAAVRAKVRDVADLVAGG